MMQNLRPVTEYDCRSRALTRTRDEGARSLPAARDRAEMYATTGRAAHPDCAASASAAYGLAEAAVIAAERLLGQLDNVRLYYSISLPIAGESGVSQVQLDDTGVLMARYPSGRIVRLRAQVEDLCDFAIVAVEDARGRSLGNGRIRLEEEHSRWALAGTCPDD